MKWGRGCYSFQIPDGEQEVDRQPQGQPLLSVLVNQKARVWGLEEVVKSVWVMSEHVSQSPQRQRHERCKGRRHLISLF